MEKAVWARVLPVSLADKLLFPQSPTLCLPSSPQRGSVVSFSFGLPDTQKSPGTRRPVLSPVNTGCQVLCFHRTTVSVETYPCRAGQGKTATNNSAQGRRWPS